MEKLTAMKNDELSKKIDAINLDALTNKSIVNRQIWKKEILANKDFIAVEVSYNDPNFSFFTLIKDTVHCEVISSENKQHPVFFVTEPSKLKNNKLDHKNIKFSIFGDK